MIKQLKFLSVAEIASVIKKFVFTLKDTIQFIINGEYSDVNITKDMISWNEENTKSFATAALIWASAIFASQLLMIVNSLAVLSWTGMITSILLASVFKTLVMSAFIFLPKIFNKGYAPFWVFLVIGGVGVIRFLESVFNIFGALGSLNVGTGWIIIFKYIFVMIGSLVMVDMLTGVVRGEHTFVNPNTCEASGVPLHEGCNPFSQVHGIVHSENDKQHTDQDSL